MPSSSTASRSETSPPTRWSPAALRSFPKGAACSPRSRSRRTSSSAVPSAATERGPPPECLPRVRRRPARAAARAHVPSTWLAGGEEQMVAIGRALMSNPKLLLCDEISLGLAPIVVREVYARLPSIVVEGSSLVIVEQDIVQALKAANQVYCLQEGRIALAGAAATLTR